MKANLEPIKVCDMQTLQLEKARLRRICHQMERKMDGRFQYARKNYIVLLLNGMFPGVRKEKNLFRWITQIVKGAWDTGHLQSVLLTVVVALAEFFSVRYGSKFLANLFAGFGKAKGGKQHKGDEGASNDQD